MKYYAVIDTNVIVSAMLSKNKDSATIRVIEACLNGRITPLFHNEIIQEYNEVLHRKKFNFNVEAVSHILSAFQLYGIKVTPTPSGEILPDKKDQIFYEVVLDKRPDNAYLVTGNTKHFPEKVFIVTPAEMMAIINRA